MHRRLATTIGLGAVLTAAMVWLLSAPLAAAGDPCYHGVEIPPSSTDAATTVELDPCSFSPTLTTVAVGAKVTFRNAGQFTHLITGANQAWGSRDAEIDPGQSVSYSFDTAGIYPYACALHRGMSGAIVVGDGVAAIVPPAGVTTSGTTGSAAGQEEAAAPRTPASAASSTMESWPMIVLAIVAGVLVGGSVVWLALRRRDPSGTATARVA